MAKTEVDISNLALDMLGVEEEIASLTEDSQNAVRCKRYYNICRKEALYSNEFSFARKVVAAAPISEKSVEGYRSVFLYPSNCLRMLSVTSDGESAIKYSKFSGDDPNNIWIAADYDLVYFTFIEDFDSNAKFPDSFSNHISGLMASKMARKYSLSDAEKRTLMVEAAEYKDIALELDANEEKQDTPDSSYITTRG